jgi:hypothetical protein
VSVQMVSKVARNLAADLLRAADEGEQESR